MVRGTQYIKILCNLTAFKSYPWQTHVYLWKSDSWNNTTFYSAIH